MCSGKCIPVLSCDFPCLGMEMDLGNSPQWKLSHLLYTQHEKCWHKTLKQRLLGQTPKHMNVIQTTFNNINLFYVMITFTTLRY